jgi:MFS family permease
MRVKGMARYGLLRPPAAGRWVLAVAVLGEAMILLEATVVNVALPTIGRDLGAGVAGLQWTLNGYVLTLAALVLVGGSLSDTYGRRRIFILGVVVFVAASALCAAAPTIELLVVARFVQGIGGLSLHQGALRSSTRSFIRMIAPGRSVRGQVWVRSRVRLAPPSAGT